jgi:SAM-dependent methyltransferase
MAGGGALNTVAGRLGRFLRGLFQEAQEPSAEVERRVIDAFVAAQAKDPAAFNARISEEDEMFLFLAGMFHGDRLRASFEYLKSGKQMTDVVRQIVDWHCQGFPRLGSFLDFASGYGRFMRYLTQEMPASRIWACDIYPGAMAFQKQEFGIQTMVSQRVPAEFRDERTYECIFVASLFSHLPEETFGAWLGRLYTLLAPGGILVFSVHDDAVVPPAYHMDERGILFIPFSESRTLDRSDYGTTYVTEAFVSEAIAKATGATRYARLKKALWWYQDLYVVSRDPGKDFGALQFSPGPAGDVEKWERDGKGGVRIEGWAVEYCPGVGLKAVEVQVNGKPAGECSLAPHVPEATAAPGAYVRFAGAVTGARLRDRDILAVKAINTRGMEQILKIGTLAALAPNTPA